MDVLQVDVEKAVDDDPDRKEVGRSAVDNEG